jgi:hypothetical protein
MRSRPHPEVIAKRLDDGSVLVDLRTSRIFELNPTATRAWELLAQETDLGRVARQLATEFEVAEDEAAREVVRLVEELRAEGLLEL